MAVDVEREFLEPLLLCTVEFVLYSLTEPRLWHTSKNLIMKRVSSVSTQVCHIRAHCQNRKMNWLFGENVFLSPALHTSCGYQNFG